MGGAGGGMSNPYSMQQGASSLFGNPMLGLTGAAMAAGGSATGYGLNRALQVSIRVKVDQIKSPSNSYTLNGPKNEPHKRMTQYPINFIIYRFESL